ncbi:435_t:CDS:2 [Paraglomus occultum]|uniref:435_t:CDS:1 n=1 Tax=Paraglomus occultum TaxID=144539 RepID=A0A9N8VD79_9GLOM|nr:435_t:CDS:2 [Paraglomus occultum]
MSSSPSQYAMPTPQPYTNSSITPTYPNATYAPAQQPSQPFSSTTPVNSQTAEKSGNSSDNGNRSTGYKGQTRRENNCATDICLYGTSEGMRVNVKELDVKLQSEHYAKGALDFIPSSRFEEVVLILIIIRDDKDTGTKRISEIGVSVFHMKNLILIMPGRRGNRIWLNRSY